MEGRRNEGERRREIKKVNSDKWRNRRKQDVKGEEKTVKGAKEK